MIDDNSLLISKIKDKIDIAKSKNKIAYTDFLQLNDLSLAQKYIVENHITNYFCYGGIENADRQIIVFYPDKLDADLAIQAIKKEICAIHIILSPEQEYLHGEYLSGIMKTGLVREKFGDIIVRTNSVDGYSGADVICFNSVSKIMMDTIPYLTRFKKSNISVIPIDLIEPKIEQFEFISIIISSNRLDNFVSELAHCSRGNAQEYLKLGKVFINGVNEFKDSKKLIEGDTITIRGKGKFIFDSIIGETKNNRLNILIKKYK